MRTGSKWKFHRPRNTPSLPMTNRQYQIYKRTKERFCEYQTNMPYFSKVIVDHYSIYILLFRFKTWTWKGKTSHNKKHISRLQILRSVIAGNTANEIYLDTKSKYTRTFIYFHILYILSLYMNKRVYIYHKMLANKEMIGWPEPSFEFDISNKTTYLVW